jgi:cell division protein FtsW (lipid II flippase)
LEIQPFRTPQQIQGRLLSLAGLFLFAYATSISLSPSVRVGTWTGEINWSVWISLAAWTAVFALVNQQVNKILPEHDPYLLPAAGLLMGWGLLEISRLAPTFGLRQSAWLVAAMALFILALRLPAGLRYLRRYKYVWLTSGLVLAALTLVFGTNPMGSGPRLWLGCCGMYLQPSEPLKMLLVIYMAAYLADRQFILPGLEGNSSSLWPGRLVPMLAPTLLMTGLALSIMIVQRDLGAATLFLFIYAVMVYLALGDIRILAIGALGVVASAVAGYWLYDVVRVRVDAWLNPWLDPSGRSFQIVQSLLAVANGGVLGRGPGLGSPGLVPVAHSDFIFSAIVEETGLVGAVGLFLLVGLLVQRGLRLAINAPGTFRRLLAAGLSVQLAGQALLIIGGNLRLLPLTGVTLPFVSYGGSSLLFSCLTLLLLVKLSSEQHSAPVSLSDPRPYFQMGGVLALGLAAAALLTGWWAVYRSPELLARTDNARRSIADRYVLRGALRDRQNRLIIATSGKPSSYLRQSFYPDLGPITGYTHPVYGQAGLEEILDPYLRGLTGYPESYIVWQLFLTGSPPPGLDVRLTIDLEQQRRLDSHLSGRVGAAVLLNASTGEILALASHPGFDLNTLDQTWAELLVDQDAPLLNRTLQGLYPPGTALGPLLLAASELPGSAPANPAPVSLQNGDQALACALEVPDQTWAGLVAAGCPNAVARLGELLGSQALLTLYQRSGLYKEPGLDLPAATSSEPLKIEDALRAGIGLPGLTDEQPALKISPVQLALALAPLSNSGILPAPHLVLGYLDPQGNWQVLPGMLDDQPVFTPASAHNAAEALADPVLPVWRSLSHLRGDPQTGASSLTWYTAGTLPSWQAAPLVLVVLLEDGNPQIAQEIGQAIIREVLAINP